MNLEAWSISDIGLVRRSNQDALGCFPELGLFIVADGMGGHADGHIASRIAVDVIHEHLAACSAERRRWDRLVARIATIMGALWTRQKQEPTEQTKPIPDVLREGVERANLRILEAAKDRGTDRVMGTTVVALKLAPAEQRAHWAHAGDSRLYRLRDGELSLLTADHTLFGEPYAGKAEVPTDLPHSNRLLQALGVRAELQVALRSDATRGGDLFLLCSDGLSGLVGADAIREQLTTSAGLRQIGETLIGLAREAGGKDNASVVLVRVLEA